MFGILALGQVWSSDTGRSSQTTLLHYLFYLTDVNYNQMHCKLGKVGSGCAAGVMTDPVTLSSKPSLCIIELSHLSFQPLIASHLLTPILDHTKSSPKIKKLKILI